MDGMDMGGSDTGDTTTAATAGFANWSTSTTMNMDISDGVEATGSTAATTNGSTSTPSEIAELVAIAAMLGAATSQLGTFTDLCDTFFLAVNAMAISRVPCRPCSLRNGNITVMLCVEL